MAIFPTITQQELESVGVVGLPDTPSMTARAMQEKFEETARSLLAPKFNALAAQLEGPGGAAVGAAVPEGLPSGTPATVQGVLNGLNEARKAHTARQDNPHAVTAQQTGAYTRQETEQAIDRRVLEIGAGDMARAEYDPNGRRQDVYAYADGVGVHVYTHQKVGTVHRLTGSGACGRVKLTANVAAGDTVQVNGKTVPAYVGGEAFADALAGEALSGRWLSFVWDGAQVNFKGGGGLTGAKLALADAVPADVRRGRTFYARGRGLSDRHRRIPAVSGGGVRHHRRERRAGGLHPDAGRLAHCGGGLAGQPGIRLHCRTGGRHRARRHRADLRPRPGAGRDPHPDREHKLPRADPLQLCGGRLLGHCAAALIPCAARRPAARQNVAGKPPHPGQRADTRWKGAEYGKKTGKPGTV